MIPIAFLDAIRHFVGAIIDAFWRGFAASLDLLAAASPLQILMLLAALVILQISFASRMQKRLVETLSDKPADDLNPFFLELRYSLPGAIYRIARFLVTWPILLIQALLRALGDDETPAQERTRAPVLVPTLGPSYLSAALITIALALGATIIEPVLRWQMDAPAHFPTWQVILLGHRPELGPYLPLDFFPYLGLAVIGTFWLTLWWTIARLVRLFHWDHMGTNLIASADDQGVLRSWRTYFGVTDLANRDASYDAWAIWLPLAAVPFFLLAFIAVGADTYRLGATSFSVAFIAWLSWGIHLRLAGLYRPAEAPRADEANAEQVQAAGWHDVLIELNHTHGLYAPPQYHPARDVEPLAFSDHDLENSQLVSPLLATLLPAPHRLTIMQQSVLDSLSRHTFVHLDPPADSRTLELGAGDGASDRQLRSGNQIIIAPEGSGKTTLGMLATFNTALLHAAASLVVVRNPAQAQALAHRLRAQLHPSPLRWNLRVRLAGGDLVEDLAAGIVPDVLICDLQHLVTSLLADVETYQPFLSNLGLVVVDDLETFCGPVEVHAQLAFRRLDLRLRQLRRVDELGEAQAPLFLVLAGDTMDDLPAWARSLCGIDAVPRRFRSQHRARRRQQAQRARHQVDAQGHPSASQKVPTGDDQVVTDDGRVRRQLFYRLRDFQDDTDLTLMDLIDTCETLAVPWHYRTCGDGRRDLGRAILPLSNEPLAYVDDPLQAAVVFFQGHITDVNRELARLGRAGANFTSQFSPPPPAGESAEDDDDAPNGSQSPQEASIEPIALITIVDEDEAQLTAGTRDTPRLADLMTSLPRPFLRPPSGYLTRRHLSSELIQHWTEVADLLAIFGNDMAPILRELSSRGALLSDERTTVIDGRNHYEKNVYVRGIESEIRDENSNGSDGSNSNDGDSGQLPPPVEDVEVASRRHISVRERSTLVELMPVDADSARHRFYPGRIFETARGRHIVVDYVDGDRSGDAFQIGDIVAEPYLGPEISSPRRHYNIELNAASEGSLAAEPLFLGPAPIGVGLFSVRCRVTHRATFRLAPDTGQIRQRIYTADGHADGDPRELNTMALAIYPNLDHSAQAPTSALTLGGARVVAAGLRAVTPLVYRGADDALGIALHTVADDDDDDPELASTEGFFFYDLHGGANGAARAIERDGVEALLRLTQCLIIHCDDLGRLLASHDEWDGSIDDKSRQTARQNALAWFESRLANQHGGPDEQDAPDPLAAGEHS